MINYICIERLSGDQIDFHYDSENTTKDDSITYMHCCGINAIEAFSFNECFRLLNEGDEYIKSLLRSKSQKTRDKGEYAKVLFPKLTFGFLFEETSFIDNSIVTYTVYKDKRKFTMKTSKFIETFDFDRSFKSFIASDKNPDYLKNVEKYLHDSDYDKKREHAFELTKNAFISNLKDNWNEFSDTWLDYNVWKPIIKIEKINSL